MQKILIATSLLLLLSVQACVEDAKPKFPEGQEIDRSNKLTASNSAGNLVASAVKEYYDVDVALIPSIILKDGESFSLNAGEGIDGATRTQLLNLYDDSKGAIRTGTMRGSDIKDFILRRLSRTLDVDLQVAGIRYDLQMRGGWPETYVVTRDKGLPLEDDRRYRVAVSDYFYSYRNIFPGYYYGDNMSFSLNLEAGGVGSIKTALIDFLDKQPDVAPLQEPRAYVSNKVVGDLGFLRIAEIQGVSHLSPYRGYRVTTRGIITAIGAPKADEATKWAALPGRELPTEIIIQDSEGDGDERTSEGISLFVPPSITGYKLKQLVEVRGVVHETRSGGGMSGTSLRMIDSIQVLAENQPLPAPVIIGQGGRMMTSKLPSTFLGDLNAREELDVREGIDFWESLEGMRVQIRKPRVTGSRGGPKDSSTAKNKTPNYVEISLVAEGMDTAAERTGSGGNFYDAYNQDFNVETIKMIDGPIAPGVDPTKIFLENGDTFAKDLTGVFAWNQNTFGVGRYVFYVDIKADSDGDGKADADLDGDGELDVPRKRETDIADRPKSRFDTSSADHLTFASWNVENLGGSADDVPRIEESANLIVTHLKCPDIITLPEIQDNNSQLETGGSAANITLDTMVAKINAKRGAQEPTDEANPCTARNYRYLNIDPLAFQDGGEWGGNIRVAILYNAKRVTFTAKGQPSATNDTYVQVDGSLNQNPGRIDPLNPALEGSRKPLAAEFSFHGQRIVVIGNHFNSMLEEGSPLGNKQPYRFKTEPKRTAIATIVRNFTETLRNRDPNVRVIVAGDFNAYHNSNSMKVLAGDFLTNLMTAPGMYPKDQWYSTNYDGNSGAIDFIFASPALMQVKPEFDILHINSPYLVKSSDHDPVVARFKF